MVNILSMDESDTLTLVDETFSNILLSFAENALKFLTASATLSV